MHKNLADSDPIHTSWGKRGDKIGPRYLNYKANLTDALMGHQATLPYLLKDGRQVLVKWTVTDVQNSTAPSTRLELDGVVV